MKRTTCSPVKLARELLLMSLVAGVASMSEAQAQSMDYSALQQLFGEPVTTSATGSPQRVTEVPANMEIITADDIRRSGADNIPDILQFVAGMDVRRYGAGQAEVSVRGYNQQFSPRLLVLINGRQVYFDDYGRTAWQLLPFQLDEIRQIEVVKGPNSALFGFNAVGGVINIITYDALLDSTNAVTVSAGTQDSLSGSAVVTLHDGDTAGVRLSAGGFRSDEFSTSSLPSALGPFNQSPHQLAFSAEGEVKLAPNVDLSLGGTATDGRRFDALPFPAFSDDSYRTNSLRIGLGADTEFGLINLAAYRNELRFGVDLPASNFDLSNRVYVVQANDLFKIGADHTVRLGLEYRDNSASGSVFAGTLGYKDYAASAMWDWEILPGLALTNAVRYDYLMLRYAGAPVAGSQFTMGDYNSARLSEFSFNSGVVYKATEEDTFRLLVARGIQAPSLVDFGTQASAPSGGQQVSFVGNPTLNAASVMNYEVDFDRTLASIGAVLRAAVYYQTTDNLLASAIVMPLLPGAGGLVSYAQNVGSSSAVGGEIGLKGKSDSGVRWSASYALISIGAGYSWDRFDLDAQARWQSHFTDYNPTPSGAVVPVRIDDYVTLNARLAYRLTDDVTLALTGDQLLQSRIIEAAGIPVERRIMASVTAKF